MWLCVRILNSAVFNFRTTVLAMRLSLREGAHVSSASLRIIGSVMGVFMVEDEVHYDLSFRRRWTSSSISWLAFSGFWSSSARQRRQVWRAAMDRPAARQDA